MLTKTARERRAGRWGAASATVFGLAAAYIVVNFGLSLFGHSVPYQWRTVLALTVVAVALAVVWAVVSDTEWAKQNKDIGDAAARRRTELFGFDPLLEPDRLPAAWADAGSDHSDYWVLFSQSARDEYPAASALPALSAPAARAASDGDSPRVRKLLEEWASTTPAAGGATA